MRLHRKLPLYFVAPILTAVLAATTFASCPIMNQGPPCQEYWRADAVFIGTATRVVRVPNETGLLIGPFVRTTTHFTVEEAFKGVEGTAVVFDADHCAHPFNEGERYLVYAHYNSYARKLEVRVGNTRSRLVSEAGEDLAYIRSLPTAEAGTRLFGKVVQQVFNVKKGQFEIEPLKDIRVSVEGNKESREAVTDAEGRYEFRRLAMGTYVVSAAMPANQLAPNETIKMSGHGCIPYDIYVEYRAQVKGKVLDVGGKPVRGVSISLVSAESTPQQILGEDRDYRANSQAFTNSEGSFWFNYLPPGRYYLIINRTDVERAQGSEIARTLPRYFYPGVSDLAAATVIVVDKDKKSPEYEFVLPIQQ